MDQPKSPTIELYRLGGHVDVVPLPRGREWLGRDSRLRRCLPVMMANQMGWAMRNPVGFTATWDDRDGLVTAPTIPGEHPLAIVQNVDGATIITFRVPFLIRTSPGWNTCMRGPSNMVKDGVTALEALVETDWSVTTLTQNWVMTRPGSVTFEEGELFCAFHPVRRDLAESVTVEVRELASNRAVSDGYALWLQSRGQLNAGVRTGGAPWRSNYFRGVAPDGTTHIDDHQVRLNLARPSEE